MADGFGGSPFATVLGSFAQGIADARKREEEQKQQEFLNALRQAAENRAQAEAGRAAQRFPVELERDRLGVQDTRGDIEAEARGRTANQTLVDQIATDPSMTPVQKQLAIAQVYSGSFPTGQLDPYKGKSREQHLADIEAESEAEARGGRRGAPLQSADGGGDDTVNVGDTRRRSRTNIQAMTNGQLQEELGKALQIRQLAAQGRAEPLTQEEILILEELQREAERRQKGAGTSSDALDFE